MIDEQQKGERRDVLKAAEKLLQNPDRRRLFGNVLTFGGIAMLTGITLKQAGGIDPFLKSVSRFNDGAQGLIFSPKDLAPTYKDEEVLRPFRYNAFYPESETPIVDAESFRLKLSGLIDDKRPWSMPQLNALPQTTQITRHICVEGWSAIGKWGGVVFSDFLKRIGADTTAKYVGFKCADTYYTSIDMPTALHPQTQLTLSFDGETLPPKFGFPMKLRMPTKLGYKNPKLITDIFVTNVYPGGFWEDKGYNWFGGS
jgi:DMSO/TMAO reductase YedYZ molybdopterin-dependent catalytic subunit